MPDSALIIDCTNCTYPLQARIQVYGDDFLVIITGGREHIGAVALSQPNESITAPGKPSSTTSVLALTGHKEDLVVRDAASRLAKKFKRNFVVLAGIHWDNLSEKEIQMVLEDINTLTRLIEKKIECTINDKGEHHGSSR